MARRAPASASRNGGAPPTKSSYYRRVARRAGLHYVATDSPGITRRSCGTGFVYLDSSGRRIRSRRTLKRLESLVIPPAWTEIWISQRHDAHLQCTGRDERGRKQYLYHAEWQATVARLKYGHLLEFGRALPQIRREVQRHLRRRGWSRDKTCALAVELLDHTAMRIGNAEYLRDNESYGLTTLRNRHARVEGSRVTLNFRGKSGKQHRIQVRNARLAKLVRDSQTLPGRALLQYESGGRLRQLRSSDVNQFLAGISRQRATAKDFRTWWASVLVATRLHSAGDPGSESGRRRVLAEAIRNAAAFLGNTPTVCRKSYIHEGLMSAYLQAGWGERVAGLRIRSRPNYRPEELLLLELLELIR